MIEAGTGIGKTVSALCGTLPLVLEKGTKVLYLTRTKSQQKQVVREVAAIGHGVARITLSSMSHTMMRSHIARGLKRQTQRVTIVYQPRRNGMLRPAPRRTTPASIATG